MLIKINNITKTFKLFKRKAGLYESLKSFLNRKYEINHITKLNKIRYNKPNLIEPSATPKKPYLNPSMI